MLDSAAIADALCTSGWWMARNVLEPGLCAALQAELLHWQATGALKTAGIGRGDAHRQHMATRSDRIAWLDGSSAAQQQYLALMDALRVGLNRELMLGLFEFEAQFAHYPPGAFYRQHRDSFAGAASRVVSIVTYLNEHWPAEAGGELVVYAGEGGEELQRVLPAAGTVVVFLSEQIPHEVLPATRDRYSIAGWFRVNATTGGRLDLME